MKERREKKNTMQIWGVFFSTLKMVPRVIDIAEPDLSESDGDDCDDDDDDADKDDSVTDAAKGTLSARKPSAKRIKKSICKKGPASKEERKTRGGLSQENKDQETKKPRVSAKKKRSICQDPSKEDADNSMPKSKTPRASAKKKRSTCQEKSETISDSEFSDKAWEPDDDDDDDSSADDGYQTIALKTKKTKCGRFQKDKSQTKENAATLKTKKSGVRTQWREDEKEAVFKYLAHWIRRGRVPGKVDCEKCISKAGGTLERRDWTAVKYYVKNQIDKRNRVLAPKCTNVR